MSVMFLPGCSALAMLDGAHDVVVARAAADVAFQALADLGPLAPLSFSRLTADITMPGVQKPLQAVALAERGLHRVQLAVLRRQPLRWW